MQAMLDMCEDVREICLPLFLMLSVRYFRIVRSYPDNTKFILCSNKFWLTQYFKESFYDWELANFHKFPDGAEGINVFKTHSSDDPIIQFWSRLGPHCDYSSILGIFKKHDNYLEYLNFCLSIDSFAAQNIFLNNQNIFTHFMQYFYANASELMKKAYDNRFSVQKVENFDFKQNWTVGLDKDFQAKVLGKMPLEKVFIGDSLTSKPLSIFDIKLIMHIAKGLDKKEIMEKESLSKSEFKEAIENIVAILGIRSENEIKSHLIKKKLLTKLMMFK